MASFLYSTNIAISLPTIATVIFVDLAKSKTYLYLDSLKSENDRMSNQEYKQRTDSKFAKAILKD